MCHDSTLFWSGHFCYMSIVNFGTCWCTISAHVDFGLFTESDVQYQYIVRKSFLYYFGVMSSGWQSWTSGWDH